MKPKNEKTKKGQNESDLNSASRTRNDLKETVTNTDEQKKKTNKDNEVDPEDKPVKLPNRQDKPATEPGDPGVNPGEKERSKGKIPVNHPGNKQ